MPSKQNPNDLVNPKRFIDSITTLIPGALLSLIVAGIATALAKVYQSPIMLFAVLLGLIFHFIYKNDKLVPGIEFCSKALMRFAVALLGVRIAFSDIISLGVIPPLIIVVGMGLVMLFGIGLARLLGLPKVFGVLSAGSVAVCGASAAAAIVTVLPKKELDEKFFALTVICVTTFGTFAMIFYPILAAYLGLSDELSGIFIGGSIHDVAQVVGAGYSISERAGDIATFIKLLRVALLLPIVMVIFWAYKDKSSKIEGDVSSFIPTFLIGFFIIALITNLGLIPESIRLIIKSISSYCLVVALTAMGLKTSLRKIASVGWKPIVLVVAESIIFAVFILVGIYLFL